MKKDIPSTWTPKQAGIAILISDKVDFNPKLEEERKSYLYREQSIKRLVHL
jgi:hypothetical protein